MAILLRLLLLALAGASIAGARLAIQQGLQQAARPTGRAEAGPSTNRLPEAQRTPSWR